MKTLRARLLFPLFTLLVLLAVLGARAEDDRGGFANKGDVVGYWTLIPMSAELTAKNTANPWPQPHQYFAIYANGEMFAHMSTHATTHTHESLDQVHKIIPHTVHYKFNPDGFMVVTRDDLPDQTERWGVNLLAQDFTSGGTDFKARDLIMSLDDGHGNVVYRRLLRPISPTE